MNILKAIARFFLDIIQVIVFAISIFLFIYLLILQPHKIKGRSMEPNFLDGEFLLTDKISYRFNEPERGDVVVFKAPTNGEDEFIKRIIGLPGDEVVVSDGKVWVNGKLVEEAYLGTEVFTPAGSFVIEGKPLRLGQDQYFVLGDNRSHSLDSRSFGPVEKSKITGKAWVIYWPPQKAGTIPDISYSL